MRNLALVIPIERRIYLLRGRKVMLDRDLAELYGVATKVLNQAVKRHVNRFPLDFMFELDKKEAAALRSQSVTLEKGRGRYAKYLPHAFTEQGVAMLSSVLNSEQAIQVNITIMRAFARLRGILASHQNLAKRLEAVEKRLLGHDVELGVQSQEIKAILEALHRLMEPPLEPSVEKLKPVLGFKP